VDTLDTVTELAGEGTDLVQSSVDFMLGANLENLNLTGAALVGTGNELANRIVGTGGANTLSGLAGNDYIYGGAGNDTITGGAGRDQLFGEAGADVFAFDDGDFGGVSSATADYIRDFSLTDGDTINLSAVDAIAGGGDNAFAFIGTAAFSGTAGELRFQTSATGTTVMGDTNGDGAADFWITLTGVHALDVADFWL
jgi:Ca2+-binding RTX toxin-like protein